VGTWRLLQQVQASTGTVRGVITDARAKATYDFGVSAKLVDPAKVKLADAYTTDFVRELKVLP